MSEPQRYLAKCPWYSIEMQTHPRGEFVLYSDYARLKAEVERLQSIHSIDSIAVEQLKAQVYRLTNLNLEYMNKGKSHQDWIDGKDFTK